MKTLIPHFYWGQRAHQLGVGLPFIPRPMLNRSKLAAALKELSGNARLRAAASALGERISLSGLSRFFSKWLRSPVEVVHTWLLRFRQRLEGLVQAEHGRLRATRPKSVGRPKATVVTGYLIFDDSVHTKPRGEKLAVWVSTTPI